MTFFNHGIRTTLRVLNALWTRIIKIQRIKCDTRPPVDTGQSKGKDLFECDTVLHSEGSRRSAAPSGPKATPQQA
jgi:hypothetical protein